MCSVKILVFNSHWIFSKFSGSLFGHSQYLGNVFYCAINQFCQLRDSTDFETQLYLCNEAFKVWTLTPFNSSKATKYLTFANLTFKAQTLKLKHVHTMEVANVKTLHPMNQHTLEVKSPQK